MEKKLYYCVGDGGKHIWWRVHDIAEEEGKIGNLYARGKVSVEDYVDKREAWKGAEIKAEREKKRIESMFKDGIEVDTLSWGFKNRKRTIEDDVKLSMEWLK